MLTGDRSAQSAFTCPGAAVDQRSGFPITRDSDAITRDDGVFYAFSKSHFNAKDKHE
jgi:hypothetical protein